MKKNIAAILSVPFFLSALLSCDDKKTKKRSCDFTGKITAAQISGTWHSDELSLTFSDSAYYEMTIFDYARKTVSFYGRYTTSVDIITFELHSKEASYLNDDKISFKVCRLNTEEATLIDLGNSLFSNAVTLRKMK